MNSRFINLFRFFFVCVDLLALNAVHFILVVTMDRIPGPAEYRYMLLFLVANMLWLLSAYGTGLYNANGTPHFEFYAKRTVKSLILFFISMLSFIFVYHYQFSRLFITLSFIGFATVLVLTRALIFGASFYMNKLSKITKKIVIVGYNEVARKLAYSFSSQNRNLLVEGYFEDNDLVDELSLLPIIGNVNECIPYAINHQITEIYSTISPETNTSIYEMAQAAERSLIRFKFVPDFKLYVNRNIHLEYLDELPILSLRPEPLEDVGNGIKKRFFDIIFS